MQAVLLLPIAEAAVFTLGLAVIDAQRRQAERLTVVLAFLLFSLVVLLTLAVTPEKTMLAEVAAAMGE